MILHSLSVQGWKCFADPVYVGPFGERINVVHGPNGSGKSSLMWALVRGLFDNHDVSGERVRALRPWGRELSPKVVVEFLADGQRYRLEKIFLDRPLCRLSRWEANRYVSLAEGRQADERLRQMFASEAPGRGMTDWRHWGLAQVLLAPQGGLHLESLSDNVCHAVRQALGEQLVGQAATEAERHIEQLYARYFTDSGRRRSGASAPEVVHLEQRRGDLLERLQQADQLCQQFDQFSRRIEDLRLAVDQLTRTQQTLKEQLTRTQAQVERYRELTGRREVLRREVQVAEQRYQRLESLIADIANAERELQESRESLARLEQQTLPLEQQLTLHRQQCDEARKQVERVRQRRGDVQAARHTAELAQRFTTCHQQRTALATLLKRAEQADQLLQKLRQQRRAILCPTVAEWRKIQKTARTRDDAKLRLDSSVVTLRFSPERPLDIQVFSGDPPGSVHVTSGNDLQVKGRPDVLVTIPGVATLHATGPVADIGELEQQWQEASLQLEKLTERYGTIDLPELEARMEAARQLDEQMQQLEVQRDTLLDGKTIDELHKDLQRIEYSLQAIYQQFPQWRDCPPDGDLLARQAQEVEHQFTQDIDQAEANNDRAQQAFQSAQQAWNNHHVERQSLREKIQQIEHRLSQLRADGLSDQERQKERQRAAMEWQAARGELEGIDQQLEAFGTSPEDERENLQRQLERTANSITEKNREIHRLEGQLESLAQQAPYSTKSLLEEQLKELDAKIEREKLQMDAIGLLYQVLSEEKRRSTEALLGPVQRRAVDVFRRVNGGRFANLQFDDSLLPQQILPQRANSAVELEHISGGEREQLYFAVRLALAEVAFRGQRQLLVLDDVFVYTDAARLARIATLLDEAADRFQIILLTCHPERYGGLKNAQFFDVEQLPPCPA